MTLQPVSPPPGRARRALRWVWGSRLAQAAVLWALFLGAGWVVPGGVALFAMLALSVYSIVAPVSLLWTRRFWRSALASAGIWLLLFWALSAGSEALNGPLRDDAMVFLLPFMIFPAALGIVTIAHWVRRPAAPPSGGTTPVPTTSAPAGSDLPCSGPL